MYGNGFKYLTIFAQVSTALSASNVVAMRDR